MLIKKNPFYNNKKFEVNNNLHKLNQIFCNINTDKTIDEIHQYFADINKIFKFEELFFDALKNNFIFGLKQLCSFFPKQNCAEIIFWMITLFLSNPSRSVIKSEKNNLVKYLINTAKEHSTTRPGLSKKS